MKIEKITVIRVERGVEVDMDSTGRDLNPGDMFVAPTLSWFLLTCKEVDLKNGWVIDAESTIRFDLDECHKVVSSTNNNTHNVDQMIMCASLRKS